MSWARARYAANNVVISNGLFQIIVWDLSHRLDFQPYKFKQHCVCVTINFFLHSQNLIPKMKLSAHCTQCTCSKSIYMYSIQFSNGYCDRHRHLKMSKFAYNTHIHRRLQFNFEIKTPCEPKCCLTIFIYWAHSQQENNVSYTKKPL